jgi:hypothetical protein
MNDVPSVGPPIMLLLAMRGFDKKYCLATLNFIFLVATVSHNKTISCLVPKGDMQLSFLSAKGDMMEEAGALLFYKDAYLLYSTTLSARVCVVGHNMYAGNHTVDRLNDKPSSETRIHSSIQLRK